MTGMVSGVYWEWNLLLHTIRLGIQIGLLYDGIRIFRMLIPHKTFLISLEDLGYWIYVTAITMELQFEESNGVLRGFAVLGIVTGMFVYNRLLGIRLILLAEKGTNFIKDKLTWIGNKAKMSLYRQRDVFRIHRSRYGKETNPGTEEKTE